MSIDFVKIHQQFPNSWLVNISAPKFSLNHLASIYEQLAQCLPTAQIVWQNTLIHPLYCNKNSQLSKKEWISPVIHYQWIIHDSKDLQQDELIQDIRQTFSLIPQDLPIDFNVTPIKTVLNQHKLALFDMDSTLIEQEVIVELAKYAGVGAQVNEITEMAMRGEIDFRESFIRRVGLLKGLSSDVLETICQNLTFSLGAKRLINALKQAGYHVVLVSGGFSYFAKFVQQQLGIDEIYANELDIVDGQLTGKITSEIVDGKRKAEILQQIAQRQNLTLQQTIAVGDGANDLPMLALADIGIAYRAKPIVQQQANYAINVAGLDAVMGILGFTDIDFGNGLP